MTLNYSNSHSSISGRWIWLWGQQIKRTQGASFKSQISISLRSAALLPPAVLGFGQRSPEQIYSCNLLVLWASCVNIHLQIENSSEVAAKYSSAGMEEESVWKVSKGILTAAFPAKGAGHSLQSSPRVKWAPSALSLLLARGRWKASKGTSFYNTLLN